MDNNVVQFDPKANVRIVPLVDDPEAALEIALPVLRKSIENDARNVSMEDFVEDVREGRSMIWAVYIQDTLVAAFTTSVAQHPQRLTLHIEYMGGRKMGIWMKAALNALRIAAKKAGLSAIEADGRIGFSRFACDNGFVETHRHFEMEL